jgi:hypothetical protein
MWVVVPSTYCPSAPASADSTSASGWRSNLLERFASSKGKPTAAKRWHLAWTTAAWSRRLYGRIYEPSTAAHGVGLWIASLRASRASRSAGPDDAREGTTSTGSGSTSPESSTSVTPPSSSSRTSTLFDLTEEARSSETLPHSGTYRSGTCFRRGPSEPRILARDSSFSPQNGSAWTTPCADDTGLRKAAYAQGGRPLSLQVREYCQQTLGFVPATQNPDFRDALMEWPVGWSDCGRPATGSYRTWLLARGAS